MFSELKILYSAERHTHTQTQFTSFTLSFAYLYTYTNTYIKRGHSKRIKTHWNSASEETLTTSRSVKNASSCSLYRKSRARQQSVVPLLPGWLASRNEGLCPHTRDAFFFRLSRSNGICKMGWWALLLMLYTYKPNVGAFFLRLNL